MIDNCLTSNDRHFNHIPVNNTIGYKLYFNWKCTYIVFILECQKIENKLHQIVQKRTETRCLIFVKFSSVTSALNADAVKVYLTWVYALECTWSQHKLHINGGFVGTLNIQNAKSNLLYLKQCLKRCDVLCIQEHWYFSYEENDLINISSTHETQAKSVDDYTEKENCIHGRGYGGVAIFWRKDIDHAIKSHDDGRYPFTSFMPLLSMNCCKHLFLGLLSLWRDALKSPHSKIWYWHWNLPIISSNWDSISLYCSSRF
jgi:hypothetical protein